MIPVVNISPCQNCQIQPNRPHWWPRSTHRSLPTTTHQPPPTSTGLPQPFQNLSDPQRQPFHAFLYVRFRRFRRFFSRRFSTVARVGAVAARRLGAELVADLHENRGAWIPMFDFGTGSMRGGRMAAKTISIGDA